VDDGGGVWRHQGGRRRHSNERYFAFLPHKGEEAFVQKHMGTV
jgi:hypothetical protein